MYRAIILNYSFMQVPGLHMVWATSLRPYKLTSYQDIFTPVLTELIY